MVTVAKEMQKASLAIPLLIGGATTSKIHTAVKIDPYFSQPVIYVRDASKVSTVVSEFLSTENKDSFRKKIKKEYADIREEYLSNISETNYVSLKIARENRLLTKWEEVTFFQPQFLGNKYFIDQPLDELVPYIDWTFFFHSWKISGKYPFIFEDTIKGKEAKKLFDDAQKMLSLIIREKMLRANAALAFYPANSSGDDVMLFTNDFRNVSLARLSFLRNQQLKDKGTPNLCLSDFIAPDGYKDYIGIFAVTAGLDIDKWIKHYTDQMDDYSSIMLKFLADRLAEAFAELLHHKVRTQYWGYEKSKDLPMEQILMGKYNGIRPAPGYPACPEHSEKRTIFDLMEVEKNCGINLTESFSMIPAASVSGYYFSHPFSQYFQVGKIGKDQVKDYAERKSISFNEAEKLLSASLNY
jgi:5-methyltetrahydrofolate--homocysteine methyltransferase